MELDPYQPPEPGNFAEEISQPVSEAEEIRLRCLTKETAIKSMARVYLMLSLPMILLIGMILKKEGRPALTPDKIAYCGFAIAMLTASVGLLRLQPWGRILAIVVSVPLLVGFPIGTLAGGYLLKLLVGKNGRALFTPFYRGIVAETPSIRYQAKRSDWIAIAVLLIVALVVVVSLIV